MFCVGVKLGLLQLWEEYRQNMLENEVGRSNKRLEKTA